MLRSITSADFENGLVLGLAFDETLQWTTGERTGQVAQACSQALRAKVVKEMEMTSGRSLHMVIISHHHRWPHEGLSKCLVNDALGVAGSVFR